jgi:peptidoglycan/xylan/chitin deacetylase (PgdA/CDA1 family)
MRLIGWIVVCVAMSATTMAGQSSHDPAPAGQPGVRDAFAQLRQEWARNLHDKHIDASVAEYTADGDFVQPDGTSVRGTAALKKLFEMVTATYDSDLAFESHNLLIKDDRATDLGIYRETLVTRATGETARIGGRYMTVYQKQADGSWRIMTQSWTNEGAAGFDGSAFLIPHPVVALTFDDLPAAGSLPPGENRTRIATRLAAELKAAHLEGTYGFVNAVKLENDPDAQQALHVWVDAGMNIGSHTWSHISLTENTAEAFEHEIALNEPALAEYAGTRDWHWFRYPYLWEGDTLEKRHAVRAYLHDHGYKVAQVSLDFEDYAWNDPYARCVAKGDQKAIEWLKQSYLDTAAEYIKLGREEEQIAFDREFPNVMLLHATAFSTLMVPELIDLLHKQGFQLEGLAEVERDAVYSMDPDAALKYGGTLPDQFMDSRKLPYPKFKPKPFNELKKLCQ